MKSLISTSLSLLVALALLPGVASGAGFIKFDGIDGEVTGAHRGASPILSLSHQMTRPKTTRSRVEPVIGELQFAKELDKATPKLMEALTRGTVISQVEIELTVPFDAAPVTYLKIKLTNVNVTSVEVNGSGLLEGQRPFEQISLSFESIEVIYTEVNSQGGVLTNTPFNFTRKF